MDLRNCKSLLIIGSNPATISFANYFIQNTNTNLIGLIEQFEGILYPHIDINEKPNNLPRLGRDEDILGNEWNRLYLKNNISKLILNKGSLNKERIINWIEKLRPDVIISHGPERISKEIIDIPRFGGLNVHWGLSPYYRGMHTSRWPIIHNKLEAIGLTIHKLDDTLDTGPIIHQSRPKLKENMSYKEIEYSLTNLAKYKIDEAISYLCNNKKIDLQDLPLGRQYLAKEWTQVEQEFIENKDIINNRIVSYNKNIVELNSNYKLIDLIK